MIFRPELARKIIRGEKTMTRRPIKPGEKECRYRPGRTYSVQRSLTAREREDGALGRSRATGHRIEILAVDEQTLADLAYRDARAEGFRDRAEFFAYWAALYGLDEPDLGQPVWAITFRLFADTPRLLIPSRSFVEDPDAMKRPEAQTDHGYTSDTRRAMPDEPEAVDEHTQERYAKEAREKERATRREVWLESRVRLQAEIDRLRAANLGAHTANDIAALQSRVRSLDRKLAA